MKTRLIYLLLIFFSLQFTLLAQTDRKITLDFQNEELPAALKKTGASLRLPHTVHL